MTMIKSLLFAVVIAVVLLIVLRIAIFVILSVVGLLVILAAGLWIYSKFKKTTNVMPKDDILEMEFEEVE